MVHIPLFLLEHVCETLVIRMGNLSIAHLLFYKSNH